jgi:hypothetical protein
MVLVSCMITIIELTDRTAQWRGLILVTALEKHKILLTEVTRIHYNFVKQHQALENQTPAQRAGIGIKGNDKWMTMMKNAKNSR